MKFFAAIVTYLFLGVILGWGILRAVHHGSYWLLIAGLVGYTMLFGRLCLPPSKSH